MRWEYLRVHITNSHAAMGHIAPARAGVIDNAGNKLEWKKQQGDSDHSPVVGRLLTKLGEEEWELAGVVGGDMGGDTRGDTVLYFKRPKGP